jgi:DHA1 family bicyclomycin/chloramphenicol resistance-like MFS transporter
MYEQKSQTGNVEFICLMAVLMSLVALAIDAVLPALTQIGESLGVESANSTQLIISVFFIGMSFGQMIYGPISDSFGRKKALYLGMLIFLLGSVVSLVSTTFTSMLIGRAFQGFGISSCRVISLAMIRDKFEGREMARIMSLIMVFFIMVPAVAPSLGQIVLFYADWRAIFSLVIVVAVVGFFWLFFRQAETLAKEKCLPFRPTTILAGIVETLKHPLSRAYMLAAGIIFGAFIGYLSSAPQILQIQYGLGEAFSLYFGGLAVAIGISSFFTSKLVMRFGMEKLSFFALTLLSLTSLLFFLYAQSVAGHPPLFIFMVYLTVAFFCFGVLFGGFNTLAVQPLGHIAGVATSVISSVQTLVSVAVGGLVGQCYDGTVLPLVLGFFLCGLTALAIMIFVRRYVAGADRF